MIQYGHRSWKQVVALAASATQSPSFERPALIRSIRLPQAVALYVGAVLGSGVLLVPGLAAEMAGPASILVWFGMSLLALPLALTLGFLSSRYPDAGGVSTFVRRAFGPKLAAVAGWLFLASVPVGAPVAALTAAGYAGVSFGLGAGAQLAVAAAILAAALMTNYLGIKALGRVQVLITAGILALLVGAVAVAAPHIEPANFTPFAPGGVLGMGRAAAIMFWCYIGWEAVSHLTEEFADPRRDVLRAIGLSALVVGLIYCAVAVVTVGTGSYGPGLSAGSLALLFRRFAGPVGGYVAGGLAVAICVGTINAYVGAASRLAYSLAREGAVPQALGYLHPVYRTPVAGLALLAAGFAASLSVTAIWGVHLGVLLFFPNASFIATYVLGSLAATRLLRGMRVLRLLSWISLALSLGVYGFLGWAALYPPVVAWAAMLYLNRRPPQG